MTRSAERGYALLESLAEAFDELGIARFEDFQLSKPDYDCREATIQEIVNWLRGMPGVGGVDARRMGEMIDRLFPR